MGRKVIYVYEKLYEVEKGFIKIGDASIDEYSEDLRDNSEYLRKIAEDRIRTYEISSPINILYVTLAVNKKGVFFRDHLVHDVLVRSGFPKIKKGKSTEWFKIDVDTAKKAIEAVKNSRSTIENIMNNKDLKKSILDLREEQESAVKQTIDVFKKRKDMLWNAKMRFGKTVSALELIKRKAYKKTIIITHRPIVDNGWFEDFHKIFYDTNYIYSSKRYGENQTQYLEMKTNFLLYTLLQFRI